MIQSRVFDPHIGEIVDHRCLLSFFFRSWVLPTRYRQARCTDFDTIYVNGVARRKDVPFSFSGPVNNAPIYPHNA